MISWIVRRPNFNATEFKREKDRLDESWKHLTDSAESLAGYVFAKSILNGTAYERGSLESRQSLAKVSIKDVQAFHGDHFTPGNSLLMVVGRVEKESYRKKISEYFGDWKGGAPKKAEVIIRNPKFTAKKDEILIVDSPGLPQAQVRMGFPIPGIHSPKRHALAVANAFLGEYFNSRLNLIVRDRLGLAYGIQSSLTYLKKGAFLTIASATAASNSGKLHEEVIRQLRLMRAADILAGEVETAKDYLIGGYPLAVSTLGAVASRWLAGHSFNLGPGYMNEFVSKISVVTREALVQSVDEAFKLDKLVTVYAGDAKAIEKSLREKGFKRFRIIPAKSLL
jgi:predicted Zn-dependent peptidase